MWSFTTTSDVWLLKIHTPVERRWYFQARWLLLYYLQLWNIVRNGMVNGWMDERDAKRIRFINHFFNCRKFLLNLLNQKVVVVRYLLIVKSFLISMFNKMPGITRPETEKSNTCSSFEYTHCSLYLILTVTYKLYLTGNTLLAMILHQQQQQQPHFESFLHTYFILKNHS